MSKIIYIANITLPSERAHGIQVMKTCEALVKNGEQVELWVTNRRKAGKKHYKQSDVFEFYGIKFKFPIKKIPVIEFLSKKWKLYFCFESLSFLAMVFFDLLREKDDFIIYTRDESVQFLGFFIRKKMFWEAHIALKFNFLRKARLKKICGIIAISESFKNFITRKYGVAPEKISVAHDAVDLEEFNNFLPKNKARELLNMPQDKKIVVYIGGIMKKKGIFVLLDAAAMMRDDCLFEIVGWFIHDESDKAKKYVAQNKINNVVFRGYAPRGDVPKYLSAADVLVIPNSSLYEETKLFTSPMKLFEYMSSGRPIVASATPTMREILNENNAILIEPDSPKALKEGILKIFQNNNLARLIAENSKKDVQNYTWLKRAEKISAFIKEKLSNLQQKK